MENYIQAVRDRGGQSECGRAHVRSVGKPAPAPLCGALFGTLLAAVIPLEAEAQGLSGGVPVAMEFDVETLRQRGVDPRLAEYFREAPKFTRGVRVVSLVVNGTRLGMIDARFDQEGELCFDDNLLAKARLRVPDSRYVLNGQGEGGRCYDFVAAYPQSVVTLRPNRQEVFLVVPQDAMLGNLPDAGNFTSGGTAGILNYDVMALRSSFGGNSRNYVSASTEVGFNMGDWIVRSRQIYTRDEDRTRFNHLYAYGQRTFPEYRSVFQAGQININSPLFAGAPITGVQVLPDTALLGPLGSGALVQGIAQSQATVEVRQAGVLIYTTMVPEGPFSLGEIPLLNTATDLDVTLREADGAERRFVVPAASYRTATLARPGYSFAVGKVRRLDNHPGTQPWVATAAGTWKLRENVAATVGAMGSSAYQSLGWGADASLGSATVLSVRNLYSNAKDEDTRGVQGSVALSTRFMRNLSASLSATQQTKGFRDLPDTTLGNHRDWYNARYKSQYSVSLGWASVALGGFNVSYVPSRTFDGYSSNRLIGSWGKTFTYATLTASVETSLGGSNVRGRGNDNAFYLNASIPLGSRSVRTYVSRRGDTTRTGAAFSDIVNDQVNYRLAAEHNSTSGDLYASANLAVMPRYTSLNLGYSHGGSSRLYSGRISGGAVAHKGGVTFSPYPVQETFGIVEIGDVSGVKVTTPYGPVWTDASGQAVVPQLNAYRNSRVEVQTRSLPRRVDLQNAFQMVEAGRGSVNHLEFRVIKAHRILANAVDDHGRPLPKGASVLDGDGNFITVVLDNGIVFISDADPEQVLTVSLPDDRSCQLAIDFPLETDDDAFYDVAPALCRAI